jgi:hypothetical protein
MVKQWDYHMVKGRLRWKKHVAPESVAAHTRRVRLSSQRSTPRSGWPNCKAADCGTSWKNKKLTKKKLQLWNGTPTMLTALSIRHVRNFNPPPFPNAHHHFFFPPSLLI